MTLTRAPTMHKTSFFLVVPFLASLATPPCVGAQTDLELPSILRDMPRSGAMCRNERLPGAALSETRSGDIGPGTNCALPPSAVAAFLHKGGAVVIDTRHESDFARFHIANAMHADAATVRFKAHLRDKPLLLVGDGKSDRELYGTCGRLRSQGFKSVQVLMGGMAGYLAKDLPVSGQGAPDAFAAAQLDPAQLWAQSQFAQGLVVVVGSPEAAALLPMASHVTDTAPRAVAAIVERRRKEHGKLLASVTVVADGSMSEATFRAYVQAVAPTPLLVYVEGAAALKGFVQSQEAVWAAHARGPKPPRCG